MSYSVGQILFVVLNKKGQVYPMQVVEEITKKTLRGEETTYVLQGGSDPESRLLIDKVDGEIFDSAEDARSSLVSRATAQINKLVSIAVAKSKEWYGKNEEFKSEQLPEPETLAKFSVEKEEVIVQLPDGTKARLRPN